MKLNQTCSPLSATPSYGWGHGLQSSAQVLMGGVAQETRGPTPALARPATPLAQCRNRCSRPHPGTAPLFNIHFALDDFNLKRNYHPTSIHLEGRWPFGPKSSRPTLSRVHLLQPQESPARPFEGLFLFLVVSLVQLKLRNRKRTSGRKLWFPPSLTLLNRPPPRGPVGSCTWEHGTFNQGTGVKWLAHEYFKEKTFMMLDFGRGPRSFFPRDSEDYTANGKQPPTLKLTKNNF